MDVGTIRVHRHPEVEVVVREAAHHGADPKPIRSAIKTAGTTYSTGTDGTATLRIEPDGILEVFAIGYSTRSLRVPQAVAGEVFVVELKAGVSLDVALPTFPPGPTEPLVLLEWESTPFESAELDGEGRGDPYSFSVHQELQTDGFLGGGSNHVQPGARGDAAVELPSDGCPVIGCLVAGSEVRTQLVDCLRQPLASVQVVLEEGVNRADLRSGWQENALALEVRATWADGTPVASGSVHLVGGADRGDSFGFEEGAVTLGPLAAGSYGVQMFVKGAQSYSSKFDLSADSTVLEVVLERL